MQFQIYQAQITSFGWKNGTRSSAHSGSTSTVAPVITYYELITQKDDLTDRADMID